MKGLGIKGRILLLTLLPTSLLALVLSSYFCWGQLTALHAQLVERGQTLVRHLAPLAAPALQQRDEAALKQVAKHTLEYSDVRSVRFLDTDNTVLAHTGPRMLNTVDYDPEQGLIQLDRQDSTRFRLPVFDADLMHHTAADNAEVLLGWIELELSHQRTQLTAYRNLLTSLLLISLALVVSSLFALRISRSIREPLQNIKSGVMQLKDGHLQTRLAACGSPEVDELSAGINSMAEALQQAQEELQHSIEQATEDVRQNLETIEIQNIELDLARKEALEASRIKSEFLANMSHEIRTPLNGILGFTQLLQKSDLAPRQRDYLITIEQSSNTLLSIINEILDFSKIEAGKLTLESMPFNLRDLLHDVLNMLAPAAHTKHIELIGIIYRDTPLSLIGDPLRLKQILTNLLSNAIKFTERGCITVRAMLEENHPDLAQIRISVKDTGIGLSPCDQQKLFRPFSQISQPKTQQSQGTGLGLAISKRLVERMGGEIGVSSCLEEGSEFWISLTFPKLHNGLDDLPQPPLKRHQVAIFEPHELARQALLHLLEDCGQTGKCFPSMELLLDHVHAQKDQEPPLELAVLSVSTQYTPLKEFKSQLQRLEQAGCKTLLLCPTTEQAILHSFLADACSQIQCKPVSMRKLQKALGNLYHNKPGGSEVITAPLSRVHKPSILCVDDNPSNLLLIKILLEDLGADVHTVTDGQQAVETVKNKVFNLIFMDIQMPGLDGRQTTELIRQWEAEQSLPPTPIIALTAHMVAGEKRGLLQSGLDDCLSKPITEQQLTQVILKWTGLPMRGPLTTTLVETFPENTSLVFDPEEGVRLASGKIDLAADMLSMLLCSLENDLQTIREARQNGDMDALAERIHRLHGATRYCGVPQLRAACVRCGNLLKQNAGAADSALDELEEAIERLSQKMAPHPEQQQAINTP